MRKTLISVVSGLTLVAASGIASAHSGISVGINFGVPVAAPVYVAPPPVYYRPAPVYYYAPPRSDYYVPSRGYYAEPAYYGPRHGYQYRHQHGNRHYDRD